MFLIVLFIFKRYFSHIASLEAGDNWSLTGIEPRTSYSASQELNHYNTAAPYNEYFRIYLFKSVPMKGMTYSIHGRKLA